jgi:hypothetical protein
MKEELDIHTCTQALSYISHKNKSPIALYKSSTTESASGVQEGARASVDASAERGWDGKGKWVTSSGCCPSSSSRSIPQSALLMFLLDMFPLDNYVFLFCLLTRVTFHLTARQTSLASILIDILILDAIWC